MVNKRGGQNMEKKIYVKPEVIVEELAVETMLAASTDRIPVGGSEIKPSATNDRRGTWGNLWADGIDE